MTWNAEFQAQLDQLTATAQKLNAATEGLNRLITEFEAQLTTISPGVTAYTPLSPNKALGYGRFNGTWRLILQTGTEDNQQSSIVPLQSASRHDRIEAVKAFPELVKALTEAAAKIVGEIRP